MTQASENQAKAMGFTLPQGWDLIKNGDDAITNNARVAAGEVLALRAALGGDPLPPIPTPDHLDWVDVGLKSGFAFRPGNNVQVAVDGYGLVHLRGHMNPDGFTSGSAIVFATVPAWAAPAEEVRWIGFQTGDTGSPVGGYISAGTGDITMQVDGDARVTLPTTHFSIICQAWESIDPPASSVPDMHGTGSPLGVVTPARAGIIYTDALGTAGAWRWIATGTTPADWRVMYGDTGPRAVQWFNLPGPIGGTWTQTVQRSGDVVTLTVSADDTTAAADALTFPAALTPGFTPHGTACASVLAAGQTAPVGVALLSPTGFHRVTTVTATTGSKSAQFAYHTSDPWPATLPGDPA